MTLYLLMRSRCDGGNCDTDHYSLHKSFETAKTKQEQMTSPDELDAKEAPNRWTEGAKGKLWEFRTGSFGMIVWHVMSIEVED